MTDLHFLDANGNHFVVPDAPAGYERDDDATLIAPPPSVDHRWIDGAWVVPAPEPEPLAALAPWQFRAMVRIAGYEQQVKDFIAALPEPQKSVAEAQLEFSLEYRRDHPLVEQIRQVIGLSEAALDDLWQQGLSLTL